MEPNQNRQRGERRSPPENRSLPDFRDRGIREHIRQAVGWIVNPEQPQPLSRRISALQELHRSSFEKLGDSPAKTLIVAAVLGGLAQLHRRSSRQPDASLHDWLKQLVPTVQELAPRFSAAEVATVAPAMVELAQRNTDLFAALALCAEKRAPEFKVRHVSDSAWAFSQRLPGRESLFRALGQRANQLVDTFDARHITDLMVAFSSTTFQDPQLFAALWRTGAAKVSSFAAEDLLAVAKAMPKLCGPKPSPGKWSTEATQFLDALTRQAQELMGQSKLSAHELAAATRVFNKLTPPNHPLRCALREHALQAISACKRSELLALARALCSCSPGDTGLEEAIRERAMSHLKNNNLKFTETLQLYFALPNMPQPVLDGAVKHLRTCSLRKLQQLAEGAGTSRRPQFKEAIRRAGMERIAQEDTLQPEELATAARFLNEEPGVDKGLAVQLRTLAVRQLAACSPSDLANLARPFALLFPEDDELFKAIGDAALEKTASLLPNEIAFLCRGFQTARYRHERLFQKVAGEVQKKVALFNSTDIAQTAYSFAFLNIKNRPMLLALATQLFREDGPANGNLRRKMKDNALFAWSCAVFDRTILNPHYKPEDLDHPNLDSHSWLQLFQALHASGILEPGSMPARYDAVKAEVEQKGQGQRDRFTQRVKASLLKILEKTPKRKSAKAGKYELKLHTFVAGAVVDIELRLGKRKIIIECDGEKFHRSRGPSGCELGKDVLQRKNVHLLNYEVIQVSSEQWSKPDTRNGLLKSIKKQLRS